MKTSIVAAVAENGVIGKDGWMPWTIPADLKHFKELTSGNIVIMGRKTYETIGKPLPNRHNIVISKTLPSGSLGSKVIIARGLREAMESAEYVNEINGNGVLEAFIIGGGEIYKESIDKVDTMYITIVSGDPDGDTHFPTFYDGQWNIVSTDPHDADDKNSNDYMFCKLERT